MNVTMMIEMRGFTQIASALSKECESIGITPERVRSSGIDAFDYVIRYVGDTHLFDDIYQIGGDTWCIVFRDLRDAIQHGCKLLLCFRNLSIEKGFYYLKPSVAVRLGYPKTKGDRFLDDGSIQAYFGADKGTAFRFLLIHDAVRKTLAYDFVEVEMLAEKSASGEDLGVVRWDQYKYENERKSEFSFDVQPILLDSELLYSRNHKDAISNIIYHQNRSHRIMAFGGPAYFDSKEFYDYMAQTIKQIKINTDREWMVLSYLPVDEPKYSFAWLELGRRLSIKFGHYFFAAFPIDEGALRPFSYHIFDEEIVHIGLRKYSPRRDTPTLSSAIMLRNKKIAESFTSEFHETWRKYAPLADETFASISKKLIGLSVDDKKESIEMVDNIMALGV